MSLHYIRRLSILQTRYSLADIMKMRLLLLTTVLLFPLYACATGDTAETASAPSKTEQNEAPAVEVPGAAETPTSDPTPDGVVPAAPETSTDAAPETQPEDANAAAADSAINAMDAAEAESDTAAGATTTTRLRTAVSAPMVSEPWNHRQEPRPIPGVIDNNDIVAFYGHPLSYYMGILGEAPLETMAEELREVADEYDAINGDRGVVPAFHIIYATAYADANVGILDSEVLEEYIAFAEENGFAVILDHQLGKNDVVESVQDMLPYLDYSSVHIAIDPEWSTLTPNENIGSVEAEEINEAQQLIHNYLEAKEINQRKMFIVHQFNWVMIQDRPSVRSDFERVDLVHNADGFGPPRDKHQSWDYNRAATNMPLKGFKLFYPKEWRDGGFDDPLMTPLEVLSLDPRPVLIMYQ